MVLYDYTSDYDLRCIIENNISYSQLYKHFCLAHESQEMHPQKWYDEYVCVENVNRFYEVGGMPIQMVADVKVKYNE